MNSDEHEEENLSPSKIIELFERIAFERGQDIHDQVESMVQFWSSTQVDRCKTSFSTSIRFPSDHFGHVRCVYRLYQNDFSSIISLSKSSNH